MEVKTPSKIIPKTSGSKLIFKIVITSPPVTFFNAKEPKYKTEVRFTKMKVTTQKTAITVLTLLS